MSQLVFLEGEYEQILRKGRFFTGNWFHIVQKKAEPHLLSPLFTFLCGYSVSHKLLFETKVKNSFQAREPVEPVSTVSVSFLMHFLNEKYF